MGLFTELKRRNVFRVGFAYAISAWMILQVADVIGEIMELPEWGGKLILLLLIVGFVPALIFAWAFELTPDGLKREKDVDRSESITQTTGRKLDRAIMLVMALALVWFAWDKFSQPAPPAMKLGSEPFSQTTGEAMSTPVVEKRALTPGKSIAVLPFVNMSNDPDQEYFSDGLAEELLNRLAKISELRVAARTSAFQFKGQNLDIAAIGRQLKVDNVLEGSVRKAGNRVRVTAQLINAEDGYHLWSETYERELDDIFAIQDDISGAISDALEVELGVAAARVGPGQPHGLEAYNLYLQARYLLAQRGGGNMLRAVELFRSALAHEPTYVEAWSGLAFTISLLPNYSSELNTREATALCIEAAGRALELDPGNPEALVARGRVRAAYQWDWAGARQDFEQAFTAAPNDTQVLNLYGDFLAQTGDFARAEAFKKRLAFELDPLSPVHANDLYNQYVIVGMYPEGLEYAQRTVSLDPDNRLREEALIYGNLFTGNLAEAQRVMDKLGGSEGLIAGSHLTWPTWLAYLDGDVPALRTALDKLIAFEKSSEQAFWNTTIAFMTLWLDGVEAALPWLDRAYQAREFAMVWPDSFFLPELYSTNPAWLAFWQRPGLAELVEMRRANGQTDIRTAWRPRPESS
jgi:TolB-like protein/Tfp pilus assembly protein PilF